MALDEGIFTTKPAPLMTQWWKDICTKIEARDFVRWSDLANVLLNVSFEDQKSLERRFRSIAKNVQKNWRRPGHNCAVIVIPHTKRTDALAIVAFKARDWDRRHERIENVAMNAFASSHVERCVAIGVNIDKMHYPYSLMGMFFKNEEKGAPRGTSIPVGHSSR
jgi:hypothetical protein